MPPAAQKKTAIPKPKATPKTTPPVTGTKKSAKMAKETPVPETPSETVVTPNGTRVRREVNVSSVDAEFTSIIEAIQAEIANSKSNKFLRAISKRISILQKDTRRVTKQKRKNAGTPSPNSGFLKSSKISDELADFLGLERGTVMSRVEATKALHNYIVTNKLQNPENGRDIVANKALTKLLKYNQKDCVDHTLDKKGKEKNPEGKLYYYVMQQLIQKHFE